MITGIRGFITRLGEQEVRLQVGSIEYQILIPEFVRRNLQDQTGSEIALCTEHYIEGGQGSSHMIPRLVGFLDVFDLNLFLLFCTVNKIGPKKALKAFTQKSSEIAQAIARKDAAWLTKLPGIGKQTAENIIAQLYRHIGEFCLSNSSAITSNTINPAGNTTVSLLEDAHNALVTLGFSSSDAIERVKKAMAQIPSPPDLATLIQVIFSKE